jgi:hypothetical protein
VVTRKWNFLVLFLALSAAFVAVTGAEVLVLLLLSGVVVALAIPRIGRRTRTDERGATDERVLQHDP